MRSHLCLTVRFLDPTFHGRGDVGEPEWPPSPLRLFQALVAAASARWDGRGPVVHATDALRWLEAQPAPTILAPPGRTGTPYRLSVPNNALDIVARAWCRGNTSNSGDANPATHRAMKTVVPVHLPDGEPVHYLWELPDPVPDDVRGHVDTLSATARSVVALGWGMDLAVGVGEDLTAEQTDALAGERWRPGGGGLVLRVPVAGTLAALVERHAAFLGRVTLDRDGFVPVPALAQFAAVGYRREEEAPPWPFAAFELVRPDGEGFRTFDPVRRTVAVAGMARHATAEAARQAGWPADRIAAFVQGHGDGRGTPARGEPHLARFAYLPLPSLERRHNKAVPHVTAIRRLLIAAPPGQEDAVVWATRALAGRELRDAHTGQVAALLSLIPRREARLRDYADRDGSASWSTVSPVVLPGHDDRDPAKAEALLRKAIRQAGYGPALAEHALLEWRNVGYRPGLDLSPRYVGPAYLRGFSRYHVRVVWRSARGEPVRLRGPVCLGAGRYVGLGLLAAEPDGP